MAEKASFDGKRNESFTAKCNMFEYLIVIKPDN